jgi:D-alanine-D-alanine ligase
MNHPQSSPVGVVVLYNESQKVIIGEPHDLIADNEVIDVANSVAEALSDNYRVVKVPIHTDVEIAMAPYPPTEWVVFNLGESVNGRLFECARIAWALEAMGYCFTGASGDALAHTTHKAFTKLYLDKARVPSPPGWMFRDPVEVIGEFLFPLIVKPVAEDGSAGIQHNAVVHDIKELKERVEFVTRVYRQAALAEMFIIGREFNVSMWNNPPETLPLCEIDFSNYSDPLQRIVSFAAKWETGSFDYDHTPGICPAQVNRDIQKKLNKTALDAWNALKCKDYTRVDIRLDESGIPYVVEINCNPDLAEIAGFFRSVKTAGYTFKEMVAKIVEFARVNFSNHYSFNQMQPFLSKSSWFITTDKRE